MTYQERQDAAGFKVGDKVTITRSAADHEDGWRDSWVHQMTTAIGKIGTIARIEGAHGIEIVIPNIGPLNFHYPYFVLQKVGEATSTDKEKEGLEKLRPRIKTSHRIHYPTGDDWWGVLVYTIIDGKTFINSWDGSALLANCTSHKGNPWWSPEEISNMNIVPSHTEEWDNKTYEKNFPLLTAAFNLIRKEGMSDVMWLKDHPYYTQKQEVVVPVLKKDVSEGDKLMAFFFAPKDEKRPKDSPYEFL